MPKYAKVVVNLSLDRTFDYLIPESLAGQIHEGVQVNVPFGRGGTRRAYVVGLTNYSNYPGQVKAIDSLCEAHTRIPESLLNLGKWMAEYYCCSREQAVRALLPSAVRTGKVKHKTKAFYAVANPGDAEKFIVEHGKKAKAKARILQVLLQDPDIDSKLLLSKAEASPSVLKQLVDMELVVDEQRIAERDPYAGAKIITSAPLKPTPEQAEALNTIFELLENKKREKHVVLLHGVTGSGKTEVYLQAISRALEAGLEVIVLVPEISLTPQTVRRFRARFGTNVSVLHSQLSEGERFDEWNRVNDGKVKIAVGARSALFAPFRNLGMIIVDEEHETSYKQAEAPRYHARDVAVMRGKMENAVVVLGSATPSFESYHNALSGKYLLAGLPTRVDNRMMPVMRVIDLKMEAGPGGPVSLFSKELTNAINERIKAGEQTIIFYNRRGYARQMLCPCCGYVATCPDCSVAYIYHRKHATLSCYLCGRVIAAPNHCPDCNAKEIKYQGVGTEKIEAMFKGAFPEARLARMDSDTMTRRQAYEDVLNNFKRGSIDILIGTQMIAKGLHFPNVTLVGIINADQSLSIPDFRSEERTFQLLTQVSGRAGRGEVPGEVVVQTFSPYNPTIIAAVNHEFESFFEEEMEVRKQLGYPPAGHLIAVHLRGENPGDLEKYALEVLQKLQPSLHPGINVTEPSPSPIERIKKKFRYQMLFRGIKMKRLREHIRHLLLHGKHPKGIEIYADVDATHLM